MQTGCYLNIYKKFTRFLHLFRLNIPGTGTGKIIPGQEEFGKWHPGWRREYPKPFFTVYRVIKLSRRRPEKQKPRVFLCVHKQLRIHPPLQIPSCDFFLWFIVIQPLTKTRKKAFSNSPLINKMFKCTFSCLFSVFHLPSSNKKQFLWPHFLL